MKPLKLIGHFICAIVTMHLFGFIAISDAQEKTTQETHGDQSPAINAKGDVTIIYQGLPKAEREVLFKQLDNSPQLVDRLLKELDAKDAALHEARADRKAKKAEIEKWVKKYEELKKQTAKLPENSEQATKAKAALIEGDLKKAKSAVTISGCTLQGVSFN